MANGVSDKKILVMTNTALQCGRCIRSTLASFQTDHFNRFYWLIQTNRPHCFGEILSKNVTDSLLHTSCELLGGADNCNSWTSYCLVIFNKPIQSLSSYCWTNAINWTPSNLGDPKNCWTKLSWFDFLNFDFWTPNFEQCLVLIGRPFLAQTIATLHWNLARLQSQIPKYTKDCLIQIINCSFVALDSRTCRTFFRL